MEIEKLMIGNDPVVTQGYDIHTDSIVPSQIFNVHHVPTAYGMAIPSITQIQRQETTDIFTTSYDCQEKMVKSRLAYLHFNLDFEISPLLFRFATKAGIDFSSKTSSSKNENVYYHTLLHEEKQFNVFLGNIPLDKNGYTNDFIAAVQDLPLPMKDKSDPNEECCPGPNPKWTEFFRRWGQFVVTKASGGGSIEVALDSSSLDKESKENIDIEATLKLASNGFLNKAHVDADAGESKQKMEEMRKLMYSSTVKVTGGIMSSRGIDPTNPDDVSKWRESVKGCPEMLTTSMTLEPMTTFIKIVDPEKFDCAVECFKKYLQGQEKERICIADTKQE